MLSAKVTDGLWICSSGRGGFYDPQKDADIDALFRSFVKTYDIDLVLNFSKRKTPVEVESIEFALPQQELMDVEIPRTIKKLEIIADEIKLARNDGCNVLVMCKDGKNVAPLVAAHYLISQMGVKPEAAIKKLETIYYTDEQKNQEIIDDDELRKGKLSKELQERVEMRREIKCLQLASFRKMLKMVGK